MFLDFMLKGISKLYTMVTSAAALSAIVYRLTTFATKDLPHIAPQIAASLWSCKDLLSSSAESLKQNNEASVAVHRFRTQLSTLLQDRTVKGRWAAVVLVKAAVEAGGIETLSKSGPWVRNLLGVLKKPDPHSTRCLAVVTLTRLFMLTWDYPNLVREITTPALPTFVSTCLSNIGISRCSASELQTVLEAFATLVPRHPTIFRTNETQIRSILAAILSQTSSTPTGTYYRHGHQHVAQHLLVLLHYSAPKQDAAQKWDETLRSTLASAHATCNYLLRSVIEDWQSVTHVRPSVPANVLVQGDLKVEGDVSLGLSGWNGVYAGCERLLALVGIVRAHVLASSAGAVDVRLGQIADVLARLFSLRQPQGKHNTVQGNPQISKEEREAVYHVLPAVHLAATGLAGDVLHRFGSAAVSLVQPLLSQVGWVFEVECSDVALREAVYRFLQRCLNLHGLAFLKEDIVDVEGILKMCCQDLLAPVTRNASVVNAGAPTLQASGDRLSHPVKFRSLHLAASDLLRVALSKLSACYIPKRLRQLMDYTAALTEDKDALVASVLNPSASRGHSSLLPLLARYHAEDPEVEALLRPRMALIALQSSPDDVEHFNDYEDGMQDARKEYSDPYTTIHGAGSESDNEPTAGLLTALYQQEQSSAARAETDELYLASLQRKAHPPPDRSTEKRNANEEPAAEPSAKRLRASPMVEALLPTAASSLPEADSVTAAADVPATVTIDQPPSSFVTAPEPSQQTATLPAAPNIVNAVPGSSVDAGSDDSDFEMPPLTMEPDTDPEDDVDG